MVKDKVKYRVEHLDSYDGQNNYELGMYINDGIQLEGKRTEFRRESSYGS